MSALVLPITRRLTGSITAALSSGSSGAGGGSYPVNLAFYALDTQDGEYVGDVIVGTGSAAEGSTSLRYYPDDGNVWRPFASGAIGRFYWDGDWWYPFCSPWTNSITYSTDLTHATWAASNVTVAKTQTGMRADANGACLLTATANNGTVMHAGVTAASAAHGARWFLKRNSGTGTVSITLDNGSTWVDITAELAASSGWYEAVDDQVLANPRIGIRLGTSGDAVSVGNAELAVNPCVGSETPYGILRWNSPIFTSGASASVTQTVLTASGVNYNPASGFYYVELAYGASDPDYGLTDIYIPSFSATASDATPCNFANGSLLSGQYLQPAPGGSTTQVTRPANANMRRRITSWYSVAEATAQFSVDGDLASGASPFASFDSDGTFYIIRRQAVPNLTGVILIRNFRAYNIASMAEGYTFTTNLVNGTESWGGQNLVMLSHRMDLYVHGGNPWSVTGATCSRNAPGIGGLANTACTITDPDGSLRLMRQIGIAILPVAQDCTVRFFVRKDAITARFPEFSFQLSGGTAQTSVVQLNTSTGAIAARTGSLVFIAQTYALDPDWWEVIGTIAHNGTNTSAGFLIYPAYSASLGGVSSAALTGSVVIANVEVYQGLNAAAVSGRPPVYTPQVKAPEVNPS